MDVRIGSYLGSQMTKAVIALQASVFFDEIEHHQQGDLDQRVFFSKLTWNFLAVMEAVSAYPAREMSRSLRFTLKSDIFQLLSAFHALEQHAKEYKARSPYEWHRFTVQYFRNLDDTIPDSRSTYSTSSEPFDDLQQFVRNVMTATDAIVSRLSAAFGENDSVKLAIVLLFRKIETMMLQGIISYEPSNFSSLIHHTVYLGWQFTNELLRVMPSGRTLEEVFERFDAAH